jgi:hypothetical protein
LDTLLLQTGGAPMLLRNDQNLKHNWLRLKLTGTKSNPDAIGARVTLKAGGKTLQREVAATRSYLSQSELPLTFGLGKEAKIHSIEIRWPTGATQLLNDRAQLDGILNTSFSIIEPSGEKADLNIHIQMPPTSTVEKVRPSDAETLRNTDKTLIIREKSE